jgi:UvrB/uvrC motif/SnoaL-like domain
MLESPDYELPRQARDACADDTISLSDLKKRLGIAVSEEKFMEAARLRDQIAEVSHDNQAAVEYCNTRFYEAFRNASVDGMEAVWGEGDCVQCIHPGMAALLGVSFPSTASFSAAGRGNACVYLQQG